MAKSNHIPVVLYLAAVLFCGYAGGADVVAGYQLLVVREGESQKQKAKSTKRIVAGYQLPVRTVALGSDLPKNMHRVMGFSMNEQNKNLQPITYNLQLQKYQDEVFLGVKSVFPTTNNQQQTTTFQLPTTSNQQPIIKKIYDSQLGVREHGFNAGREVEEYLRYVNLEKGQPWCAAFICWVYGKAGVKNPRTGWSPDLFKAKYVIWNRGKEYQVSRIRYFSGPGSAHLTPENPQPDTGDIFGIFFPEKGRIAHAGFIDRWDETWLVTVEGNTNMSGSPEGDGVYRKRRLVRSIYQVARYVGLQDK
ncbi:MAG: hypothetical protein ACYCZO_07750 [Daejeonella sp.]